MATIPTTTSDEQTGAEPVLVRDLAQPARHVRFAITSNEEQTGIHPAPASDPQAASTRQPRVDAEGEAMTVLHEESSDSEKSDNEDDNLSFMDIPCDKDDDESANLQDSNDHDIPPPRPQRQLDHDLLSHSNSNDEESPASASEPNNEEEDPDEDLSEDLPSRNAATGDVLMGPKIHLIFLLQLSWNLKTTAFKGSRSSTSLRSRSSLMTSGQ
jgi:hypothetical protein